MYMYNSICLISQCNNIVCIIRNFLLKFSSLIDHIPPQLSFLKYDCSASICSIVTFILFDDFDGSSLYLN